MALIKIANKNSKYLCKIRSDEAKNLASDGWGSGGLTPGYAMSSMAMRKREEGYAHSWFNNITNDVFG